MVWGIIFNQLWWRIFNYIYQQFFPILYSHADSHIKKWNLFSFPNCETFFCLGQTLICAPWLRTRESNFTLSCSEVALQAGRLQRTTSGIIIKIRLEVAMVTACWGSAAARASPHQLPCEMQRGIADEDADTWNIHALRGREETAWMTQQRAAPDTRAIALHGCSHPPAFAGRECWSRFCAMLYLYSTPKIVIKNG